jgi:hypothetical protein
VTSLLFDKGPPEVPSPAEVAEPLLGRPRLHVPELTKRVYKLRWQTAEWVNAQARGTQSQHRSVPLHWRLPDSRIVIWVSSG